MNEMEILMYLLCGVLGSVSGQFFHESSGVTLKPAGALANSDFGFSIAYQDRGSSARLVVGAPRQDYFGKVYSCPLSNLSSINCSIDITSLQIESKIEAAGNSKYPDAHFFYGSSIAATSDYFFTCAPLLIKTVSLINTRNKWRRVYENVTDSFGGCYVNDYSDAAEWIDSVARLEDKHKGSKSIYPYQITFSTTLLIKGGGLGWNTLVDDSFLIAAKSGQFTDILYTNVKEPLTTTTKSFFEDKRKGYYALISSFSNLGYGLAVGNFFNVSEKLYAVSVKKNSVNGTIFFLEKKHQKFKGYYLDTLEESADIVTIETLALSSMFGYAMAAVDMNRDGLSELLVGAPAQTEDGRRELGALHVYVGGDLVSRNDRKRMRTVLADKVNGRFGSAIATSDIDGDSLPEIFVSAPYEDSGVVYALSGYELKQVFFKEDGFKLVRLSDLALTQALRGDGGLQLFGFSLQVVKDVDENGCDELAIGAPDSSSVKLVRCLPAVNTTLTLKLVGNSTVALDAKSFVVEVCLHVTFNKKCQSVSGNILVESFTTGHTNISEPQFLHNITTDDSSPHCKNIIVDLTIAAENTVYTFATKLSMADDPNPSAYNSLAVFSAYSEKEKSIPVRRYCTKANCEPDLWYEMFWSGDESIDFSKSEAINETLTFEITNKNNVAYSVVLELEIRGGLVRSGECVINKNIINVNNDVEAYYTCALVKTLKTGESYNMTVPIYLPAPTNSPGLNVSATLYDTLFANKTFTDEPLFIPFVLETSDVTVIGSNNSLNVTDKDLQDGIIFTESNGIHQEFIISNTGPITWYHILAVLEIKNEYIQHIMVVTRSGSENEKWVQQNNSSDSSLLIFHNRMTIKPTSTKIIEVTVRLSKDKLEGDISKGSLSIDSELAFVLDPLSDTREAESCTQIIYAQILTVGNNKSMIILIVVILAVLLLLILMYVLYKNGFFKRAEKKKLSVLRESIRKRSVRLASEHSRSVRPSVTDGVHCDMEVVDDCAFHDVDLPPTSNSSDRSLVETSSKEHMS